MLTVWGRRNSSNVQPVMWAVGELGLNCERRDVGGSFEGLDDPDFRAMNPNGLIPVIQDGDFVLWESNAILRHLARAHGEGSLLPDGARDLALADQWLDWHKTTFAMPIMGLFFQTVRTEPDARDMTAIAKAGEAAAKVLAMLDTHLDGRDFMAGSRLSTADLPIGTAVNRYMNLPLIERPALPNVEAWFARLQDRPAFQEHIAIPFGANPTEWLDYERGVSSAEEP